MKKEHPPARRIFLEKERGLLWGTWECTDIRVDTGRCSRASNSGECDICVRTRVNEVRCKERAACVYVRSSRTSLREIIMRGHWIDRRNSSSSIYVPVAYNLKRRCLNILSPVVTRRDREVTHMCATRVTNAHLFSQNCSAWGRQLSIHSTVEWIFVCRSAIEKLSNQEIIPRRIMRLTAVEKTRDACLTEVS